MAVTSADRRNTLLSDEGMECYYYLQTATIFHERTEVRDMRLVAAGRVDELNRLRVWPAVHIDLSIAVTSRPHSVSFNYAPYFYSIPNIGARGGGARGLIEALGSQVFCEPGHKPINLVVLPY